MSFVAYNIYAVVCQRYLMLSAHEDTGLFLYDKSALVFVVADSRLATLTGQTNVSIVADGCRAATVPWLKCKIWCHIKASFRVKGM